MALSKVFKCGFSDSLHPCKRPPDRAECPFRLWPPLLQQQNQIDRLCGAVINAVYQCAYRLFMSLLALRSLFVALDNFKAALTFDPRLDML